MNSPSAVKPVSSTWDASSFSFGEFFANHTHAFLHGGISAVGQEIEQYLDDLGLRGARRERRARVDAQWRLHDFGADGGERRYRCQLARLRVQARPTENVTVRVLDDRSPDIGCEIVEAVHHRFAGLRGSPGQRR